MKKPKVLLIGPFPNPVSGVSLANQVVLEGLRKNKVNVDFIDTEYQKELKDSHGQFSLSKLRSFKMYLSLPKVLQNEVIYITVGQSFFGLMKYLPFLILAKIFGKKSIMHLHGGHLKTEYEQLKGIKKKVFYHTLNLFDQFIVLSPILKNQLAFLKNEKPIHAVYNFFQDSLIENFNIEDKNYKELQLIYLSNLLPEKGINIFLQALLNLQNRGIAIKTKIAGNVVPTNTEVLEIIENLEAVEYVGAVGLQKKSEMLKKSNVFVLPTYYKMEGQPISILEAMAMGNAIVTTRHSGIVDVCNEENTYWVEKESVRSLENTLEEMYDNKTPVEYKGRQNHAQAIEKFREEKFVKNIEKICQDID